MISQSYKEEHAAALRAAMADACIDSFLTSDDISLRWLSGFTGSAGTLLVTDETCNC